MTKRTLQFRRGTQSENASFVGALGEITVDTTRKLLVVHDGSTAGGNTLAPLDSPSLSGTPTAPTQTSGNNSTRLATTAFVQTELSGFVPTFPNTDSITEGSTKLFFTNARARTAISVSGNLSYSSSTGVISYTTPTVLSAFTNDVGYLTNASVRTQVSATGSIAYNSSTGVFSYTETVNSVNSKVGIVVLTTDDIAQGSTNKYATSTTVRGYVSGTSGVSFNSSTGVFSLATASILLNSKSISLTSGTSQTLTTDDITEGTTNKYATSAAVRAQISAGTGIAITNGQISIDATSSPSVSGLTVTGTLTVDTNTIKVDATNNRVGIVVTSPQYELDVAGDVNLTGKLRLSGVAGTAGYVMQSGGASASPTWASVNSVLPSITELDPFVIDGGTTAFVPKNNNATVTITAPIQALIIKNGVTLTPFTSKSNPMWFSGISYGDYTVDTSGRIVFSSVPQVGDKLNVRILVGNTANTLNTTYPYRAIDIMTGY